MKRLLLASIAALIALPAFAQTNTVATPQRVATYSATITALTPAASATDFFTITGSASRIVRVKRVMCFGASTADGTAVVQGIKRSAADTAGTSTTPTVVPYDSTDGAGTAVVRAYTANPTGVGTSLGVVRAGPLSTAVLASSANAAAMVWDFGGLNTKELVLRGTGQMFALNNGGASFVAGASLTCSAEWTEGG